MRATTLDNGLKVLVQEEQSEALQRLAETDPLTWLFNRRHFDKRLEAETNRALRAELARVREQRDILKKSLGILSEPPRSATKPSTP